MRRVLASLLVLILTLTSASSSLATENTNTTLTVNEYQFYKDLKQKTDEELIGLGYSKEKIKEIKTFDYVKAIKERAKQDDAKLKISGYTDEQIKILRNFNGTEQEIIALAASISLTVTHKNFHYDTINKRSYWRVYFAWNWTSEPFFRSTDIIGAGWEPTMSLMESMTDSYQTVTYKRNTTGATWSKNYGFSLSNTNCGASTFPVTGAAASDNSWYDWAVNGIGYVKVTAGGQLRDMQMRIAYGHKQLSSSDPTLAAPFGISFTFSSGINQENSKTIQYFY